MTALYFPALEDEEILRISDRQPCVCKEVTLVGGRADLVVVDHFGVTHQRNQVSIGRSSEPDYCILL